MFQPEISIWRGREKVAHFAGGLNGPESASIATSIMEFYFRELDEEAPEYISGGFPATSLPSPCVVMLFYPGYDNLSADDQLRLPGIIQSIILGIHFMANC